MSYDAGRFKSSKIYVCIVYISLHTTLSPFHGELLCPKASANMDKKLQHMLNENFPNSKSINQARTGKREVTSCFSTKLQHLHYTDCRFTMFRHNRCCIAGLSR